MINKHLPYLIGFAICLVVVYFFADKIPIIKDKFVFSPAPAKAK